MANSFTAYADSMESAYQNANSSKGTNKFSVTPDPVNPGTGTMPGGASKNTPANDQTGASKDSLVKGSTKTPTPSNPTKGGTSNPYTPVDPGSPTPSNPTNLPTGGYLDPQKYEPSPGTPSLPTGGYLEPQKYEPSPGTPTLPTGGDLDPQKIDPTIPRPSYPTGGDLDPTKIEPSPGTPRAPTTKTKSVVGDTYTYEDFVREAQEAKRQQEQALSMVKDLPDNLVPDQVKSGQYTWSEWLDFAQQHPSIPWNVKFNQWKEEFQKGPGGRTGGDLDQKGYVPENPSQPEQPPQPTSGTGSVSVIGNYRLPVDINSLEPEVKNAIIRGSMLGGGRPRALDSGTLSQEDYERFMQGKMSLDEIRNIIVPAFREGFKATMPERPTPTENPTGGDLEPQGYEPSPGTPNPPEFTGELVGGYRTVYQIPEDTSSIDPEVLSAMKAANRDDRFLIGAGTPKALALGEISQEDWDRYKNGQMNYDEIKNIIVPALKRGNIPPFPDDQLVSRGFLTPEELEILQQRRNRTGSITQQAEPIYGQGKSDLEYPATPGELPDDLIPEQVKSGQYSWDQWVNMMKNNAAAPWNVQYRAWQAEQSYKGRTGGLLMPEYIDLPTGGDLDPSEFRREVLAQIGRDQQQGELITPFQNYGLTTRSYTDPETGRTYNTTMVKFPDELHVPQKELSIPAEKALFQALYGSGYLIAVHNGTLSVDDWNRFRTGNMSEEEVRRYILPALEQGVRPFDNKNASSSTPYSTQANQAELRYQQAQASTPVKSGSFNL